MEDEEQKIVPEEPINICGYIIDIPSIATFLFFGTVAYLMGLFPFYIAGLVAYLVVNRANYSGYY